MQQYEIHAVRALIKLALSEGKDFDRTDVFCSLAGHVIEHIENDFIKGLLLALTATVEEYDAKGSMFLIEAIHADLVDNHKMQPIF